MPETLNACPLCQRPHSELFDRRDFRGRPVINRICSACGFVYQSPRMTQAELDTFYAAEYRQVYQGQAGPNPKDLATQKARAAHLADFLARSAARRQPDGFSGWTHLDIGSSAGALLLDFQQTLGTHPTGVEPGTAYGDYARALGLTVYPSLDALPPGKRFNLVSLLHVIEHLPDPVDTLRRLRRDVLAPGGWLLLETPNLFAHDCFEMAHLSAFSPRTLRRAVELAGFRIVILQAHGQPRSRLIPLYLTLLARPAETLPTSIPPGALDAVALVRLRRKLGFLYRRIATRLLPRQAWLPVWDEANP